MRTHPGLLLGALLLTFGCGQPGEGGGTAASAAAASAAAGTAATGAAVTPAQQAAPSAPAAPAAPNGAMFDEAFVQGVYDQAVAALEEGAGLRLEEPVPVLLLTVSEARARRKAFAQGLDENSGLTSAMDLVADFVFSDTMLGRYLPDEKVLYIIEEVLERASGGRRDRAEEMLFGVMAHELVHAYDDQVYQIMPSPDSLLEIAADGARLPEVQTLMSLVEGRATYASELACAVAGKQPLNAFTVDEARHYDVMRSGGEGSVAAELGTGMVNVLARAKLVQYAYGREFAKQAFDFGGEKFMGQVFAHLPLTMAELEDFNVFKRRWAREEEARMDAEQQAEFDAAYEAGLLGPGDIGP